MALGPDNTTVYPPQPITGQPMLRTPPRYFEFASPTDKNARNRDGVSAQTIRELVRKYGNNILIGFDMGRTDPALSKRGGNPLDVLAKTDFSQQLEAFKVAKQLGVRLHAYLGGPGGPTGSKIDADELAFMQSSARALGINTNKDSWMNEWNSWGWKESTKQQMKVLKQMGFESFEIDNLSRDAKIRVSSADNDSKKTGALIDLFKEISGWDGPRKLMLKNLNVENLHGVEQAMKDGRLNRARFADFHISEEDYQNRWPEIERASARMGIQLARSHNTHAYACSQGYKPELEGAIGQFLNGVGHVIGEVVTGVASIFGIEPARQPHQQTGASYHVNPAAVKLGTPARSTQTGWTINAPTKKTDEQPRTRWHIDLAGDTAPKSKPA